MLNKEESAKITAIAVRAKAISEHYDEITRRQIISDAAVIFEYCQELLKDKK